MSERKEPFTQVSQRTVYTCDDCGEDRVAKPRKCFVCGGDFCHKCVRKGTYADDTGGDDYGDYGNFFCQQCWKVGAKALEKIEKMAQDHDDAVSTAVEDWFAEARKQAKQRQDTGEETK